LTVEEGMALLLWGAASIWAARLLLVAAAQTVAELAGRLVAGGA
jgi:hypothetical protein